MACMFDRYSDDDDGGAETGGLDGRKAMKKEARRYLRASIVDLINCRAGIARLMETEC